MSERDKLQKIDRFLSLWTNYCQFWHFLSLWTISYQFSVVYHVLIRTCFCQFVRCFLVVESWMVFIKQSMLSHSESFFKILCTNSFPDLFCADFHLCTVSNPYLNIWRPLHWHASLGHLYREPATYSKLFLRTLVHQSAHTCQELRCNCIEKLGSIWNPRLLLQYQNSSSSFKKPRNWSTAFAAIDIKQEYGGKCSIRFMFSKPHDCQIKTARVNKANR